MGYLCVRAYRAVLDLDEVADVNGLADNAAGTDTHKRADIRAAQYIRRVADRTDERDAVFYRAVFNERVGTYRAVLADNAVALNDGAREYHRVSADFCAGADYNPVGAGD